jgi:hypothetical protein
MYQERTRKNVINAYMYFILRCTRIHNPEYGSIIHGHDSHHFNGRHSSSADEGFTSGSSPVNGMGGISGSGQGNLVLSPQSSADTTHKVELSQTMTSKEQAGNSNIGSGSSRNIHPTNLRFSTTRPQKF